MATPHSRVHAIRTGRVIVADHVQQPVDDQPRELFPHPHTPLLGVLAGDRWRDVHVTHNPTATLGTLPAAVSSACAHPPRREAERYDIGRPAVAQVPPVELRDCARRDERDRHERIANAFRSQHAVRELAYTFQSNRYSNSFRSNGDGEHHHQEARTHSGRCP